MVIFSKKGAIEISMSWIFMILIGTFFIVFAYNIIAKYQDIEETKFELEFSNLLREVLNTVGRTSGGEEDKLSPLYSIFKDREVEVVCENSFALLSIDGSYSSNNNFLKNYPIFMTRINQKNIENSYMAVTSLKIPFKVTNFLAFVSRKNLIVFDENSPQVEDIVYKFDKGSYSRLNYVIRDLSSYTYSDFKKEFGDMNLDSVVFVTDYKDQTDNEILISDGLLEKPKMVSTWVAINGGRVGEVIYRWWDKRDEIILERRYNVTNFDESFAFESMAIFSKPETFGCSYDQVFSQIVSVVEFYMLKADYFYQRSEQKELICSSSVDFNVQSLYYSNIYEDLRELRDEIKNNKFKNVGDIENIVSKLEEDSNVLEDFGCNYVY